MDETGGSNIWPAKRQVGEAENFSPLRGATEGKLKKRRKKLGQISCLLVLVQFQSLETLAWGWNVQVYNDFSDDKKAFSFILSSFLK